MSKQDQYFEFVTKAKAIRGSKTIDQLTGSELTEYTSLLTSATACKAEIEQDDRVKRAFDHLPGSTDEGPNGAVGGDIYSTIKAQTGGDFLHGKAVIPATMFGAKSDLIATQSDANPTRSGVTAEIGRDGRYLFPALPTEPLSLDPATTQVQYLQQTTRSLASAASMQLALDSSATKPTTDSVATLVTAEPKWIATISNPQPNALFTQPALRSMLQHDMAQAYADSLDDYCVDIIAAASGVNTLAQGGLVTLDAIRTAQGLVHDDGFSGDTLVLPSAVAVTIDLLKDAQDRYYGREFLDQWFKNVRYSKTLAATAVQIISSEVVTLHISPVVFQADTSLYFESNRTVARYEGLALPVVRQGTGIALLTLN